MYCNYLCYLKSAATYKEPNALNIKQYMCKGHTHFTLCNSIPVYSV